MYITFPNEIPKGWYEKKKVINAEAKYGHFFSYTYENGVIIYKFVSSEEEVLIPNRAFWSIAEILPKDSVVEYDEYSYVNDKYGTDYVRVFKTGEILRYNYGDK